MKRLTHDWAWRSDLLGRGKGCRGVGHWGRGAGVLLRLWHVILEVLSLAVLPQTQIPVPRTADNLLLKGVPADVTHTGLVGGQLLHDVATEEVVHDHFASGAATVDELLAGAVGGGESATDEGVQHPVAPVGHQGAVPWELQLPPGFFGHLLPAVVPVLLCGSLARGFHAFPARKTSDIPELDGLVFGVGDEISGITLTVNESDAVLMPSERAHRLGVIFPHGASIPHFADGIVTPGEQDLGADVSKGHRVHIILMGLNLKGPPVLFSIKDVQAAIIGPS